MRESVREQIYSQYRAYYPGIDITSMAEPLVEPAVNQAIANLDLSEINDKFDKAKMKLLAVNGNGMCLTEIHIIHSGIISLVQTEWMR